MTFVDVAVIGGLAVTAGTGIYKVAHGAHQANLAKKAAAKAQRPNYTPANYQGATENEQMYNNLANSSQMPGQGAMVNNINAGVNNSLNQVDQTGGSAVNRLAAISSLNQNRNSAFNDLGVESAQFRQNNMDKLSAARNNVDQFRNQAFDYNQNQEFQYNRMRALMLQNASAQNINNGLDSLGNTAGQFGAMKMYQNQG